MNNNQNPNGVPSPFPEAAVEPQQECEQCAKLLAQIDRLRAENVELREQRRVYASMIPISEEDRKLAELPFEELWAMCQGQPTLEEIIQQVEQERDQ